jgi:hypothetical protein
MSLETTLTDIIACLRQGRFPNEQASYEDRRAYKLDLFKRPPIEAADTLRRYLARAQVEFGVALESARQEYHRRNRRSGADRSGSRAGRSRIALTTNL